MKQDAQGSGESPSLEVFKRRGDVALRDVVTGHGGGVLVVGLGDLGDLFQPYRVCDSMTYCKTQQN